MSKINEFLVNNSGGLIKNERQANIFLLAIVIALILASILLVSFSSGSKSIKGTEYNPSSGYGGKNLPDNFR